MVQRFFQSCRYCMSLDVIQKVQYRHQQTEGGAAVVAASVGRSAVRIGLADWFKATWVPLTDMLTWMRRPWPDVMLRLLETFSGGPLVSSIMDRYFARYGRVYSTPPSEQVRGLFERWSTKFSADYYEAKDREEGRNDPHLG
jgi:hypothetical protein